METHVNSASTKMPEKRAAGGAPKGNGNAVRHGSYARVAALKGHRWDRRTRTYRAIQAKVKAYSKALGTSLSPQKRALLLEAATLEVVLSEPLTIHLASVKHVVRKGKVNPAFELRLKLSARLQELLAAVGLDKVKRQPTPFWQRQPKRRKNQDEDQSGGRDPTSDKPHGAGSFPQFGSATLSDFAPRI
jgi:hypothetical protein